MLCIELLIIPDVLVSLKMASMRDPHLDTEIEHFGKKKYVQNQKKLLDHNYSICKHNWS